MTGREAVQFVELLQPRAAVPVHYEGWSHFREQESDLRRALADAPSTVRDRIRWLTPGAPTEV